MCHGPAGFVGVTRTDGTPLVKGRTITAFTNEEEKAVKLDGDMPFPLESRLRELGATVKTAPNFTPHLQEDGNLVTGQNPMSSDVVAQAVIKRLSATVPDVTSTGDRDGRAPGRAGEGRFRSGGAAGSSR